MYETPAAPSSLTCLTVIASKTPPRVPVFEGQGHEGGKPRFLKGPIPLSWVTRAMRLPRKAWDVGTVLWLWAGITRSCTVVLTRTQLRECGVHPETARQCLAHLEHAGLVRVERQGKRSP